MAVIDHGRQLIQAWHVPSAGWHTLDARRVSVEDQVVIVQDVSDPAEYVDPADRTVRLRVVHRSLEPGLAYAGAGDTAPLESSVDQVRLQVTLP